jgi:hypothetical protein
MVKTIKKKIKKTTKKKISISKKRKKRIYRKAPKNTRVYRCVQKVKKKYDIGPAIAICQSSTKQGYRTGRTLKKGGKKQKRTKKRKVVPGR